MTTPRHAPSRAGTPCGWLTHAFQVPRPLRAALADRGSLTRRLRAAFDRFHVLPLARGLATPFVDEACALGLRRSTLAYVRDVLLVGDGVNRVFAHSVLPSASLRGGWNGVTRLGTRPLGEALFTNPRVRRRSLAVRRLDARDPLYRAACAATGLGTRVNIDPPRELWARRSIFCLARRPLLVTEVFLPAPR